MPELPEVETIKRTLETFVLNKTINQVTVNWGKIIQHPDDVDHFKSKLKGETIRRMGRKGKFLLFYMDQYVLVSHLRMEGKYRVEPSEIPYDKHTHVIFHFTDGTDLRYGDVRKFGTMHVFPIGDEFNQKPLALLAPDPFEKGYEISAIKAKFQRTSRLIKAVLLDQAVIAGLGNIYVDEVLFLSHVHPERRANDLTDNEISTLFENAKLVLEEAVHQGGTTIRSYVNGQGEMGMFQQSLFVYGRENRACKHCTDEIIKIKVAGRGTHICPSCQPLH